MWQITLHTHSPVTNRYRYHLLAFCLCEATYSSFPWWILVEQRGHPAWWCFFFDGSNPLHLGKWPNLTVVFSRMGWWKTTNKPGLLKIWPRKNWRFLWIFVVGYNPTLTTSRIFFEWNIWEPKGRPFAKKNHLPKLHHAGWVHHLWSSFVFFVRNAVQGSQESGQAHHQEAQGRDETTWASPSSARVGRGNREWTDPSHSAGAASARQFRVWWYDFHWACHHPRCPLPRQSLQNTPDGRVSSMPQVLYQEIGTSTDARVATTFRCSLKVKDILQVTDLTDINGWQLQTRQYQRKVGFSHEQSAFIKPSPPMFVLAWFSSLNNARYCARWT